MTLKELQQRVIALQIGNTMEVLQLEATYEAAEEIVEFNKDQLWSGRKADGEMMPDYADGSGPIKLFDTGSFYDGFFVERKGSFPITISSSDVKTEMLTKRYGDEIFGLTRESIKELAENHIQPILVEKIREELFV